MPAHDGTGRHLWQKKLLQDLPERLLRSFGIDEDEIDRLAGAPGVFAEETDGGVVIGQVVGDRLQVHFAYDRTENMRTGFRPAFEAIEAKAMENPAVVSVEILYDDMVNRPQVETILQGCTLKAGEDWLLMGRRLPVEPDPDEAPPTAGDGGAAFRLAGTGDLDAMAAVDAAAYGDLGVPASVIGDWLARGHGAGVVERDGRVVGATTWLRQGPRAIVRRLGVLPDERRTGYGTLLLEQAAYHLNAAGGRRLELMLNPSPAAIGFAKARRLAQQGAGIVYRKPIGARTEKTEPLIRGYGWSDMRRRR